MTYKPNFRKAEQSAYNLLIKSNFTEFPIKIKKIANNFENLKIRSYAWFADKSGMTLNEVCEFAESEEGCCYYQKNNHQYLILYNDKVLSPGRKKWTIAHEIGHYVLRHNEISNKTILARSSLSKEEYKSFEQEADCFARSLLVPPSVLSALRKFNARDISEWFEISMLAAVNTFKFFNKGILLGIKYNSKDRLVEKFEGFIFSKNNERHCQRCKHNFIAVSPIYCPICRFKKIINKKGMSYMKYSGYDLDESGRAKICPQWKNEELNRGNYCKICGIHIINRCDNRYHDRDGDLIIACAEVAEGNARFCIVCGHETTFFKNQILKHWEEERELVTADIELPF